MDDACHFLALVETLAALDRELARIDLVEECDELATFSTEFVRKRPGQDVEIWTQLCGAHDRLAHVAPGYRKSMRLRTPKTA